MGCAFLERRTLFLHRERIHEQCERLLLLVWDSRKIWPLRGERVSARGDLKEDNSGRAGERAC